MNILILGSGGREHAIAWQLKRSESANNLWCAPGNAGTAAITSNVNIDPLDFGAIKNFIQDTGIDLIIVGPEIGRAHV